MENKLAYENRIIAFVDILGFQTILNKTQLKDADGGLADNESCIFDLNKTFERISDLMGAEEEPEDAVPSRQVTQFSDAIVISFKVAESEKELRYLFEELLFLHIELLRQEILIRGGIAYGPLIHTGKVLFGPAMVQAYKVESLAANSPRIILPKSLTDINSKISENIKGQAQKLDDLITLDEDDFYYLDYFDKCQKPELNLFVNDAEYINHLKQTKEVILKGLKNIQPNIYNKYGWMKTKWNRTIKNNQSANRLELLVKEKRNELHDFFSNAKPIKSSM
ncbi:MAG: hypothetical protein KKA81_11260 [Bacteroidetes bacterium]|nr:hypothetical protein [Bacteroidota bacterium]